MRIFIYVIYLLIYILLHYIEGLPTIGGIAVAQLWKIPLLAYLIINILGSKRLFFKFEKFGYGFAITPFLSIEILTAPLKTFLFSIKQIPLILFFGFWRKFNTKKLEKIMLTLSQFICITSLLTITGLIQPLKEYQLAESVVEDLSYYSSLFGNAHAASSYFCIASIVILYNLINNKIKGKANKIFNTFLLCIGLYSLYLSFVRTGWIMFMMSLFFIIDFKKINFKKKVITYLIGILTVLFFVFLYNTNDAFRYRISGGGQYKGESESIIDTEGSGRNRFWENGVELWAESELYCKLFGNGTKAVIEKNYRLTGMPVGSHSLFIDTLAKYGVVTFILLVLFFYYQYRFIVKNGKGSPYQSICKSLWFGSLLFSIFQSEIYFDYAAIYGLTLALMYKTNYKNIVIPTLSKTLT